MATVRGTTETGACCDHPTPLSISAAYANPTQCIDGDCSHGVVHKRTLAVDDMPGYDVRALS